MPDYTPPEGSPAALSFTAGGPITGGVCVAVASQDAVAQASNVATSVYVGVAGHNAALNQKVTVLCGSGVVHETPFTGAAVVPGDYVFTGANGAVQGAAGTQTVPVGTAVRPSANGRCRWQAAR
jgi:Uncharacterized conserved protein (DUF2190)